MGSLDYYFFNGSSQPNISEEDRTHVVKPVLLFPLQLYHYSKVCPHAKSRGEEGDVLLWSDIPSIVLRAPYNAFFFYLCAFSRFFVLDSAWCKQFILISSIYSNEDQFPLHLPFLLTFRTSIRSFLPNHLLHPQIWGEVFLKVLQAQ